MERDRNNLEHCTNIHITYPALVYGFLHVLQANREADGAQGNDIALHASGNVAEGIMRYHHAMRQLTGRRSIRNEASRYECVAIALVETQPKGRGVVLDDFPPQGSPLLLARFFPSLFAAYDERYVYAAPALQSITKRLEWAEDSPALKLALAAGFVPRIAATQ